MGTPSKAKRPKCRWVGIRIVGDITRDNLNALLVKIMPSSSLKLYDLKNIQGENLAIVKIDLSEASDFISKCKTENRIDTLTSSGKIRLVRDRLGIVKPKLRR